MSDGIELSVVIPAYNEAEVIGDTIARVSAYLAANGSHELLVVDDGSRDATPAIVDGHIYLRTAGHLYCFGTDEK